MWYIDICQHFNLINIALPYIYIDIGYELRNKKENFISYYELGAEYNDNYSIREIIFRNYSQFFKVNDLEKKYDCVVKILKYVTIAINICQYDQSSFFLLQTYFSIMSEIKKNILAKKTYAENIINEYEKLIEKYVPICINNGYREQCGYLANYFKMKNNIEEAIKYYLIGAENKCKISLYNLGILYKKKFKSSQIRTDDDENVIMNYFQLASENGSDEATFILYLIYILTDDKEKIEEYKYIRHTILDNPEAIFQLIEDDDYNINYKLLLAEYYRKENDIPNAIKYYTICVDSGDVQSMHEIGVIYKDRGDISLSIKYFEMAIVHNYVPSMFFLGYLYLDIFGDIEKSIYYFSISLKMSIERDVSLFHDIYILSAYHLGNLLRATGDLDEAIKMHLIAIEEYNDEIFDNCHGMKYAESYPIYELAMIYYEKKEYENAKKYLTDAYKLSNINAIFHLGKLYYEIEEDIEDASRYLLNALENDYEDVIINSEDKEACMLYGKYYENIDILESKKYYVMAMTYGSSDAEIILKSLNFNVETNMYDKYLLLKYDDKYYDEYAKKFNFDVPLFKEYNAYTRVDKTLNLFWYQINDKNIMPPIFIDLTEFASSEYIPILKSFNGLSHFYDIKLNLVYDKLWQKYIVDRYGSINDIYPHNIIQGIMDEIKHVMIDIIPNTPWQDKIIRKLERKFCDHIGLYPLLCNNEKYIKEICTFYGNSDSYGMLEYLKRLNPTTEFGLFMYTLNYWDNNLNVIINYNDNELVDILETYYEKGFNYNENKEFLNFFAIDNNLINHDLEHNFKHEEISIYTMFSNKLRNNFLFARCLGKWNYEKKRYDYALKYYSLCLAREMNNDTILNNIGVIYYEKKEYVSSEKFFRCIKLEKLEYNNTIIYNLYKLYSALQDYKKSHKYYLRLTDLKFDDKINLKINS